MATRDESVAEMLLMQEVIERRKVDALYNFQPHAKQKAFINAVLRGPHTENWMFAANRAGKTDAGAVCGATLARFGDPDARWVGGGDGRVQVKDRATAGWVSALDFAFSRDVVQPKYFDNGFMPPGAHPPFIPAHEIANDGWRVSDQILRLKNGSLIGFKSADSGPMKYQGADRDWIHFDEEHPFNVYKEATIRIGTRKLRIFGTCTLLPPEGEVGGVSWSFGHFIEPWKEGKLKNVGLFGASIYDNPHLPPAELRRLESLYPEGSVDRAIRLDGEWIPGLAGARAYTGFSKALHVRPVNEIIQRRPLCWVWDFNVEPCVSLVGQREGTLFRVHRELILESGSIGDMCDYFKTEYPEHLAEVWLYGDATGKRRNAQTAVSDYTTIRNNMRQYPVPLVVKVPEDNPLVNDRRNAVNAAMKSPEGEINVQVDPSCIELIKDFQEVLLDNRGGIKKIHDKTKPYSRRTHASDAFGYWVSYEAPVRLIGDGTRKKPAQVKRPGY